METILRTVCGGVASVNGQWEGSAMSKSLLAQMLCVGLLSFLAWSQEKQTPEWVKAMQTVHARFKGRKGTFAHFGDSITVSMAFWAGLPYARKNAPLEMEKAFQAVNKYMKPECWREWKGDAYGSEGGMTVRWAYENVDRWLQKLNPEVALIMFGTNDLHALELEEYRTKMKAIAQKCLDNGTVVILSTIPPRSGYDKKATTFADAVREIARTMKLPLVNYHAEILRRRPNDWDGSLEKFKGYDGYDVPTLIARDGVHPSHPKQWQGDYSPEGLNNCGFSLRNYLVLMKYAEVLRYVILSEAKNLPSETLRFAQGDAQQSVMSLVKQSWFPQAPPLPPSTGEVMRVSSVEELFQAVERVKPGGTILVADGYYDLPRRLNVRTDNVTLRSVSGRRERVVLDGGKHKLGELLAVTRCSGVTIADLTVQNVTWNGIKLDTDSGVHRVTIYNCVIHNIWQRGVKGVKVPPDVKRPEACRVQFCLFYNDHPKQFTDDPADTPQNFNGDYIGGIDVMFAQGWVISDNVFVGIQGRNRGARGAVFLWHDTQDCIVERNVIIDCDTGIALGNSHRPPDVAIHCTRVVARNNFITRCPESNIVADYTKDCRIVHNTIHDPANKLRRLIRLVHDNDGLLVANNLLSGPPVLNESNSRVELKGNLAKDLSSVFVDAARGDLHLTDRAIEAIDRAAPLSDVADDVDRQRRRRAPDIGAHEFKNMSRG
jgi:hypothetical protein